MKGYRPSYFGEADISQTDLLQEDRARRIPQYAQRVAKGQPLFKESKSVPHSFRADVFAPVVGVEDTRIR
jgi:hypothetical protein